MSHYYWHRGKAVLNMIVEDEKTTWSELAQLQRSRADKITAAVDVFERASLRDTCTQADAITAADALELIEKMTSAIEADVNGLRLAGGNVASLRENYESLNTTWEFAEDVSSWNLPRPCIEYLFADPSHITNIQSMAKDLVRASLAAASREDEANKLAQFDPSLWCNAISFDGVPLQQLIERNECALVNISGLRDYLNFLLAEDAACDQGIGPVLSVYSRGSLDYSHLPQAVEFVFYRSAAETLLKSDPRLRTHSGATHQELRKRFQMLDREYLELRRKQLAIKLSQRLIGVNYIDRNDNYIDRRSWG